ncbi:hypothetical protein [Emticicia fluvialis]|uniref:hypothetical protein n=1 Tax=Emticicia fluvialis TaxID=2974474 RepID=UPI0021665419|nr:hypothetical protein [Emticicia fluvialis]
MMELTETDWELIHNYYDLRAEDFYLVINKRANFEEIKDLLFSTRYRENTMRDFDALIWHFPHSMNDAELENLYQIFIKEKWHQTHDVFVDRFQQKFNTNVKNIKILVDLIHDLPDFYKIDEDIQYPLIKKCMYAIAAMPKPESTIALEKLSDSEDETIKEYALHQLERQKKLKGDNL